MKRFIIITLLIIAGKTAFAQSFYGGLVVGGITSQVEGDNRGGFNKAGFTGGAFVGLPLNDNFNIQMELKFIQKGSKSADVDAYPSFDPYLLRLNYIDLPIIIGANFNFLSINGKPLKWMTFELGASFDVLVSHYEEIRGISTESNVWRSTCFNTVFGFRFNLLENLALSIRSINSINSIRKSNAMYIENHSAPDCVPKYVRRYGILGEFNDLLQLVVFWKL